MPRNSVFLSSVDRYVGELPKLHQRRQVPFRVSRGNVVFLSRHCFGKGPHLALRGESRGFYRVWAGSLGFLLGCDGDLRDPLLLPHRIQVSFRVARGRSEFLSSWCRGLGPHLKLRRATQDSSPALRGISGFLCRLQWEVRRGFMLGHGTLLPSRVGKGVSGLLWS